MCRLPHRYFLLSSLLWYAGCSTQDDNPMIRQLLAEAEKQIAPDRRTAVFDVAARLSGQTLTLKGEIQSTLIKDQLLQFLVSRTNYTIVDSLTFLPHPSLGEKTYGLVTVSVANGRTNPQNSAELSTQALLGTPLRILKKESGWYYVQTPDEYLGWMDDGFVSMGKDEFDEWMRQPRVIVTEPYGFSYRSKEKREVVSDVVLGALFVKKREVGAWYEVLYPDGRVAFIPKEIAQPYEKWITSAKDTPENILRTARRFFGIPYLWGGTSSKGFDCSGFTKTVFYFNGIMLPRDASQQAHIGEFIDAGTDFKNVKAGDLLFFGTRAEGDTKERVRHVGIYLNDGKFIHASGDVRVNSLNPSDPDFSEYRRKTFLRVKRIIGAGESTGVRRLIDLPYYNVNEF